jgi:hypothetical protein
LRHGFPEWFERRRDSVDNKDAITAHSGQQEHSQSSGPECGSDVRQPPHTVELLQYLRIVFSTEAMLDTVPLEAAANTGAWHAWKSYRAKYMGGRESPAVSLPSGASDATSDRSTSPRQQPGGARRPGEWNWQGVWEDRVRKSVQASISENTLYGGDNNDVICFSKMDADAVNEILPMLRDTQST